MKQEMTGWQWHQLDHTSTSSLNLSHAGCSSWRPTDSDNALKTKVKQGPKVVVAIVSWCSYKTIMLTLQLPWLHGQGSELSVTISLLGGSDSCQYQTTTTASDQIPSRSVTTHAGQHISVVLIQHNGLYYSTFITADRSEFLMSTVTNKMTKMHQQVTT